MASHSPSKSRKKTKKKNLFMGRHGPSNPKNKKGHELLEPMAFRYVLFAVDYGLPKNDGRLPLSKRRRRARTSTIALLSELTNAFFMPNVIFRKSF